MSHMVMYRSVEGSPMFHQVASLQDAVRHVETLHNAGQGSDARIFSMKEVKIEVKTYYRVEVTAEEDKAPEAPPAMAAPPVVADPAAAPPPEAPAVAEAPGPMPGPAPAPVKGQPAVAGAAANGGRFGLFGKG